jgi:hypothetical protein
VVPEKLPGLAITVYPVIDNPPVLTGAVTATLTVELLVPVMAAIVGLPGTPFVVIDKVLVDVVVPARLVAYPVTVYVVLLVNPLMYTVPVSSPLTTDTVPLEFPGVVTAVN